MGWFAMRRPVVLGLLVAASVAGCNRHRHSSDADGSTSGNTPVNPPGTAGAAPMVVALRFDALARFVTSTVQTATQRTPALAMQLAALEGQAHLPPGSVLAGSWPAGYGIDASRPVLAEVLPLAAGTKARIDAIAAAQANPTALAELVRTWNHGPLGAHVVIPATNATTLENNLTQLLASEFTLAPSIPGFDAVYTPNDANDPPTVVGLSHTASAVTVDVFVQRRNPAPAAPPPLPGAPPTPAMPTVALQTAEVRQALATMQQRYAVGTITPPGAPTAALTVEWDFRALADLNIAVGLDTMARALSGPGVTDPAERQRVTTQGVTEALTSRQLITRDGAPFATGVASLDLTPGHLAVTLSAHGSDTMPPLPNTHTTGDLVNASGIMLADLSVAFMRAWHLPGDTATHRSTSAEFGHLVDQAGGLGALLALPHGLAVFARTVVENAHNRGPALDPATTPFERVGFDLAQISPPRGAIIGLLPAGATADSAACALAPTPADCATQRLQVGTPTTLPNDAGVAEVANLAGRVVVLGAAHAADLTTGQMPLSVAAIDTPTATAWMDFARAMEPAAAAQLPADFRVLTATADATGRDITVTIAQAAAPPAQ